MSLLTRNATVSTRYGGGFVQSIDGLDGGHSGGQSGRLVLLRQRRRGVQGRRVDERARRAIASGGICHDWSATDDIRAVVGSFPQPFLNGIDGKRLPVRVECASADGNACRTVTARLRAQHVPAAVAALGARRRRGADAARGRGHLARDRRRVRRARTERRPARERRLCALLAVGHDADAARRSRPLDADALGGRGLDRGDAQRRRRARVGGDGHRRRRRDTRGGRVRRRRRCTTASRSRSPPPGRWRCRGRGHEAMIGTLLFYRRLASPLHAARASVGAAWALSLTAAALILYNPLCLLALLLAVLGAGWGAGVGPRLSRSLRTAAIVALPIVLVNVLVSREGLTVFARLGDLGPVRPGGPDRRGGRLRRRDRVEGHAADPRHRPGRPRRSTPTSCCACSGACRFARR